MMADTINKNVCLDVNQNCSDSSWTVELMDTPMERNSSKSSISSCSPLDQVDTSSSFKKRSKKKVKVPWNVLENTDVPNEAINFKYYTRNALRHVFVLLDSKAKSNGLIAKTRLQVICATICLAYNLSHDPDELVGYNGEKTELSFDELVDYLENVLFAKVDTSNLDMTKVDETAWHIVSKDGKKSELFSDSDLFRLWRMFNKITCKSNLLDVEEAALFIQNYMKALGTEWKSEPLDEYLKENNVTKLSFWDLIECLETEYIQETPKSCYLEGLETLSLKYLQEIIKTGYLKKKGHQVKNIKSRWFVFTPHLIVYYETHRMVKKKGEIIINSESDVENIPDNKSSKCRFDITCGKTKKKYEVEANDQRNKNEWIAAIKHCISIGDDVTPLMVVLSDRADKREEKMIRESQLELERLEREAFLRYQQKELEETRFALDCANIQAETEAALLDKERRRREELEAMKIEYEKLLEEERLARKEEEMARARQQELYDIETAKRLHLEQIKTEQDEILAAERKAREGLEEVSKEQAKVLEEERDRLKSLDDAYKSAAAELEAAHAKLEASEKESRDAALRVEEAKEKTRRMTGSCGLNKTVVPQIRHTTHRGIGAFTDDDFSKTPIYLSNEERPVAINRTELSDEERVQIVATNLVRPSEFSKKLEET